MGSRCSKQLQAHILLSTVMLQADMHRYVCNVQSVEEIAARRNVRHRVEMMNQDPPATCSQEVHHLGILASETTSDQAGTVLQESTVKIIHVVHLVINSVLDRNGRGIFYFMAGRHACVCNNNLPSARGLIESVVHATCPYQ